MPDQTLNVCAKWSYISAKCHIVWRLRKVHNGGSSSRIYLEEDQNQGALLVYPQTPVEENFFFAGWDDGRVSNLPVYVKWQKSWTIDGAMYAENWTGDVQTNGYCKVSWLIPKYSTNQLDHDPYKVYKSKYMKWGEPLDNIEVADYKGLDGFTYRMTGWESHPSTVPEQFSLAIHGTSERVAVQYTLTYNILWQDLNHSEVRTYETRQVYAGSELPNVDPVAPSGWHWGGVWKTAG